MHFPSRISQDCKIAVRLVNHIGMASLSRPYDQPVFLIAKYTFHIRKIYLNIFIITILLASIGYSAVWGFRHFSKGDIVQNRAIRYFNACFFLRLS